MNLETASGYRPRTQETRAAYEAILAFIREQFGDQPQDVLKGAADEILAVLKDDRKRVCASCISVMSCLQEVNMHNLQWSIRLHDGCMMATCLTALCKPFAHAGQDLSAKCSSTMELYQHT